MAMDQEQLRQLGSTDAIKNELVKEFTKHIEEPDDLDENVVKVKMVVLGPTQAGKTCWLNRLISDKFNTNEPATVGAKFSSQGVAIEESEYHFEIWDVSGEEWCRTLCPMYLQHAHAAVVCYDPSEIDSFKEAKEWIEYVKRLGDKDLIISLVGCKSDLSAIAKLPVQPDEVEKFFVDEQKLEECFLFPEVSAKTGENVAAVILEIAEAFHERGVKQARTSVVNPDNAFEKLVGNAVENQNVLSRKETAGAVRSDDKVGKVKAKMFDFSEFMKLKFGQCYAATKTGTKKAYDKTKEKSSVWAGKVQRGSKKFGSEMQARTRKLIRKQDSKKHLATGNMEEVDVAQNEGPKLERGSKKAQVAPSSI